MSADRPIAVGDLVMVVRGHACVVARYGGIPWRVTEIVPQEGGGWQCTRCKTRDHAPNDLFGARRSRSKKGASCPLSYLKRIPPLDELESSKTDEPTKEVA